MGTIRQNIISILGKEAMDLYQLAQALGLSEKETMSHLPHVARSVTTHGGRFEVRPAKCRNCGYLYKARRRLQPPGRCPRCRESRIDGPWYRVDF